VLPVYSETETVRQVVDWLRDNLAGRLEEIIIVLSPMSRDASRVLCAELESSDPRVRLHIQEHNPGLGHAVREGLAQARGNAVLMMDSDGEMESRSCATSDTWQWRSGSSAGASRRAALLAGPT
jgi:dolichol-phosphate mannosyltransferase